MSALRKLLLRALADADEGRLSAGYARIRPVLESGEGWEKLEAASLLAALRRTSEALDLLDALGDRTAAHLAAELAVRQGLDAEADRRFEALLADDGPPGLRARLVQLRLRHRDFERVVNDSNAEPGARARAHLNLGELERARALNADLRSPLLGHYVDEEEALRRAEVRGGGERTEVVRAFRAGDGEGLLRALESSAERFERSEWLVWRAEAHVLLKDDDAAYRELDAAMSLAGRPHLPALLLRLRLEMLGDLRRVEAGEMRREQTTEGGALHLASEIREALATIWGEDRFVGVDLEGVVRLLRESMERLGFHRSADVTFVREGDLIPLFVSSPREDSRRQLERLRVAGSDVALA
ncbi:MAG: hypothetical protein AAF645_19775, partial [Myxococcota bacterium]